jgi:hypothetical protein
MYNFSASLNDGSENDTEREVDELTDSVDKLGREHHLPTFTSKNTTRPTNDDGRNKGPSADRRKGNDGGATEQLETCGYEVVPDVLETDGGTWELMSRVQNTFSIHDVDCLLSCSYHLTSARCIDGGIRRRSN